MKKRILQLNATLILTTVFVFTAFSSQGIEAIPQEGHEYLYEISLDGRGNDETVLSLFLELKSKNIKLVCNKN